MQHQLAQANHARMRFPLDAPEMAEFARLLDEVNALADRSRGFVWRWQGSAGNAADVRVFDDPLVLFNMSVWESVEALKEFTYRSAHGAAFRRRSEWFEPSRGAPSYVMWWVPAGELPQVADARDRLARFEKEGDSPEAFSFKRPFPPPSS